MSRSKKSRLPGMINVRGHFIDPDEINMLGPIEHILAPLPDGRKYIACSYFKIYCQHRTVKISIPYTTILSKGMRKRIRREKKNNPNQMSAFCERIYITAGNRTKTVATQEKERFGKEWNLALKMQKLGKNYQPNYAGFEVVKEFEISKNIAL